MQEFDHDKLDVYRAAIELVVLIDAIFDVCLSLKLIEELKYSTVRQLLIRIVSMLIKMSRSLSG